MRGRAAVDDGSVFMVYCPGTKSVKDKMTPLNSNEEGSCSNEHLRATAYNSFKCFCHCVAFSFFCDHCCLCPVKPKKQIKAK